MSGSSWLVLPLALLLAGCSGATSAPAPTATKAPATATQTGQSASVPASVTVVEATVTRPAPTVARTPTTAPPTPTVAQAPSQAPAASTATAKPAGGPVPESEGQWVTSKASNATNYYAKGDPRWKDLVEANRVWFATEADLLVVFPNRKRAE